MKRFVLSLLVVLLLILRAATAQNLKEGKSNTAKTSTLSGKVSEDGKNLVARNGQLWSVTNPSMLAGHEGQQVKVKCQISSGVHELEVLSVKAVPTQTKYAANPSDSAFRR